MFGKLRSLFTSRTSQPADESAASKRQGDEHLKHDRLDNAAECYRRALAIEPDFVDACVGLGFVLSAQKRYGEAETCLHHALALDSRIADAHYILGTIARDQGEKPGAIYHFTQAVEIKPDFEFAFRDLSAVLVDCGQVTRARDVLGQAIEAFPDSAEFRFYLGNLLCHEQDYDRAIDCYRQALAKAPGSAETHKNLAAALTQSGAPDQAAVSYRKALWFAPDLFDAHIGLGGILQNQGKLDEAILCFERATALAPDRAAVQTTLGNVLQSQGRIDEAIASFRRAVALEPASAAAHQFLGNALVAKGARQEAVACFEEVLRLDPGNAVQHLVAALSGGDSDRAPSDYVENLFDQYAQKFDAHLVGVLNYTVPEKLSELLRPHASASAEKWVVLDLGCGTGLSGAAIAAYARQIVGVDLSARMLDKARERNLYHRLEQMDLVTMMQGEAEASFDLVLAADVFVYLGKLDDLVEQARRLLRPGGLFAFSVESLEALTDDPAGASAHRDYRLNDTGRYAHAAAYLLRMAARDGFEVLATTGTQSRLNQGRPVQGYLALWRRHSA